jgi:hypothetical protein
MKFLTLHRILALIWLIGLFVFAERVRGYTPAPEPERADAIVALTGPSAERVNAAIRLLEQDKGRPGPDFGRQPRGPPPGTARPDAGFEQAVQLLRRPGLRGRGHRGQRPGDRRLGRRQVL